ncbi:hypothetical protein CDAR_1041 [Caerostris darwini]|uniref:Uncharacterized protein n=1 Tax=Caerostris darwini TaxID=1538125 RepID=A0AAV4SS75_9ARAC|nr:hypothetical protein CDAR_1041 [Caerostris darwini]
METNFELEKLQLQVTVSVGAVVDNAVRSSTYAENIIDVQKLLPTFRAGTDDINVFLGLIESERMYNLLKENGVSLKTRKHDVTLADDTTQSKEILLAIGPVSIECRTFEADFIILPEDRGSYEVANLDNPDTTIGRHKVSTLKPFTDVKTTPNAPLRKTDAVFSTSSNSETG